MTTSYTMQEGVVSIDSRESNVVCLATPVNVEAFDDEGMGSRVNDAPHGPTPGTQILEDRGLSEVFGRHVTQLSDVFDYYSEATPRGRLMALGGATDPRGQVTSWGREAGTGTG
jgi:hypothetical protein